MKRLVPTFIAIALLLNACAPDAQLWGAYLTPTPADPSGGAVISEATPTQALAADAPQIILTDLAALSNPILLATTVAPQTTETPAPAIITETATLAARTVTPNTQTGQPILYYAQSGDTLAGLAVRFGVERAEITSPKILPEGSLIDPGTLLIIPNRITEETTSNVQVMPDSEVVFSATASDFNIPQFIANAGGHLSIYREYLGSTGWTTGAQAFTRLTYENSANPRLVLALLEYESHWVYSASSSANEEYPLGFVSLKYKGLFLQMVWAVNQLYAGYYGWRTGALTELTFPNGETLRLHPELNAGTVAVLYFFSRLHNRSEWEQIVNPESVNSFTGLYNQMFGDPWARSQLVEPLLPMGISQPKLLLPFEPNREWHLISGPHGAWEKDGPLAAIDLAPSTDHGGCSETPTWVLSAAPGLVVRSGGGIVVVDLDGDGLEQTGWNLLYMHIATEGRVPVGVWVKADDRIGHASCEGGVSTGTHLHFARKYNGEWILADGPLPMVLGGWTIHAGMNPYEGTMTRGSLTVIADMFGQAWSTIIRLPDE